MRGNIAQKVALTLWGNALLQGIDTRQFWQFAAGFDLCPTVFFETGWLAHGSVGPAEWFDQLKNMQVDLRLRMPARSRHKATALDDGPGADFLVEASSPRCGWLWQDAWSVRKDQWVAAYKLRLPSAAALRPAMRLDSLCGRLSDELGDAAAFTARHIPAWEPTFSHAKRILDRRHPFDTSGSSDLSPPGFLSDCASRLLGACCAAWIFGGMGNFADNSYGSLEPQVTKHCNALFATYEQVLIAVTASTCRSASQS